LEKGPARFLWLTDGPGWLKTWTAFKGEIGKIDYAMNYWIARRKMDEFMLNLVSDRASRDMRDLKTE
jgi:hypothetical protein